MELINYTLPEFCFLDANSHEGNALEDRTVIQHIRTYTIMEVVALDEIEHYNFNTPMHEFTYRNSLGITEQHMLFVHFSLVWEMGMPLNDELKEVFEKTVQWYCDYLTWEDQNISDDESAKICSWLRDHPLISVNGLSELINYRNLSKAVNGERNIPQKYFSALEEVLKHYGYK